jgi:hypothetical protein
MGSKRVIPVRLAGTERAAELLAQGWTRQTTIGEPRLSELVETYRGLGYEVEVIEHRTDGEACDVCFDAGREQGVTYGEIYTRRKTGAAQADDPLF